MKNQNEGGWEGLGVLERIGQTKTHDLFRVRTFKEVYGTLSLLKQHHQQRKDNGIVPMTILFGWLGAKSAQVEKYSDIHRSMNCHTFSITATSNMIFSTSYALITQFTRRVIEVCHTHIHASNKGKPTIMMIHCFSNAGAYCIHSLFQNQLQSSVSKSISIIGIIFDSCPCYTSHHITSNAFTSGLLPRKQPYLLYTVCKFGFLTGLWFWRLVVADDTNAFWTRMESMDYSGAPELYMFSEQDELLDSQKLEQLVLKRKRKDSDSGSDSNSNQSGQVHLWKVKNAKHVMLFRDYPQQYKQNVECFTHHCVNQWLTNNGMDSSSSWSVYENGTISNQPVLAAKL